MVEMTSQGKLKIQTALLTTNEGMQDSSRNRITTSSFTVCSRFEPMLINIRKTSQHL
jgi:hypothetical protein